MKVNFIKNTQLADDLIILEAQQKNDIIDSIIGDIESTISAVECFIDGQKLIQPILSCTRFISSNKKVFGYTTDNEFTVKYRLYQLEELLPKQFVRISNTEIINSRAIKHLELTTTGIILVHFKNGEQTSSSRRYIKKIKEKLL